MFFCFLVFASLPEMSQVKINPPPPKQTNNNAEKQTCTLCNAKYNVGFIWMVTPQGPFHRLKSYSFLKRSYHAAVHVGCMYIQWTVVHHYMCVVGFIQ